jgi:hypothetical protein
MVVETNRTPKTMTPEQFGRAVSELAVKAEALPVQRRAAALDALGDLWTREGFVVLGKSWYDAADQCRKDYPGQS